MAVPEHIVEIYRKAGYPDPYETAALAWGDAQTADDIELTDDADFLDRVLITEPMYPDSWQ